MLRGGDRYLSGSQKQPNKEVRERPAVTPPVADNVSSQSHYSQKSFSDRSQTGVYPNANVLSFNLDQVCLRSVNTVVML